MCKWDLMWVDMVNDICRCQLSWELKINSDIDRMYWIDCVLLGMIGTLTVCMHFLILLDTLSLPYWLVSLDSW